MTIDAYPLCWPEERKLGIAAGHAWIASAQAMVVYRDLGVSEGMAKGIDIATKAGLPIEFRAIGFQSYVRTGIAR